MVSFESDYIAGAHPQVLRRLIETNEESLPGYGTDEYCESAKRKIKEACACPEAEVELLAGGTQTNAVVIATLLKDHEGVIAAKTGHIYTHEAGAIEYTGHKVMELPAKEGKLEVDVLKGFLEEFYADENHEHMVFPGMVYLSHPTEYGTLYSKRELEEIAGLCRAYHMTLYVDGARLAYALAGGGSDVALEDLARICDVFYIGGTKAGALCGEAVVFGSGNRPEHFLTSVKKRGALLAKGRLLGIQFDALFTEELYFEIGRHAVRMAEKLKKIFREQGFEFFLESPTNQQFIILENGVMKKIAEKIRFSFWEKTDEDHTVVRFATGWSTTEEDLRMLEEVLSSSYLF